MKTKINSLLMLLALSLIFVSCKPQTTSTLITASLSELTGKVDVKQAGGDNFVSANADTPLEVNGQIQTGDDGRVRLDLSSRTIIRVAPSSLFTLSSNEEVAGGLATKIKLELGKIFIILNGGSADVETPSGVASVKGSYMKVEIDPKTGNIYVTCLEGNCSASNEAGTVEFTDGEKTILFPKNSSGNWVIPTVESMTPEEFQEWLDENPEAKDLFESAMATLTALAEPTPTLPPSATPTLESVIPSADASTTCFKTINPASGSNLPKQGKIKFEWETQVGAQKYVITITDAYGNSAILETTDTSVEKYIEILPNGGTYDWDVTAFGEDGSEICTTAPASFSKPQGEPTKEPTKIDEPEATQPPTEATQPPYCDPCDYFGSCYDPYYCSY